MSLIHDALKKAQPSAPQPPAQNVPPYLRVDEEPPRKPKLNMRVIVLIIILIGALIYLVYNKLFSGKTTLTGPGVKATGLVMTEQAREAEVKRLKTEAAKSFRAGNIEDTWVRLSTAGQLDTTDPEVWNNMGLILRRKGDFIQARQFFEKALHNKPNYPECLNNLAIIDMEEGNLELASERLHKAVSLRPNYPEAHFHLALIAEQRGDTRLAIGFYKKFLELAEDLPAQMTDSVTKHVAEMENGK